MKTFAVWETEYPDEGSTLFKAYSESGARRKWRKATRTTGPLWDQPALSAQEMTPWMLAEREAFYARQMEEP
jgi:hypothetical protein